jgi:flagellar assembly factor FliW
VTSTLTDTSPGAGVRSYGKGEVITFPRGLLGFEDFHEFRLERDSAWEPLAKLQSVQEPRLSFVIAPPRVFIADFCVRIDPLEVTELQIHDVGDAELWTIVTIPEDPRHMSANLQGPIVINRANSLGKQVVLTRSHYSTQHPLFDDTVAAL